MKDQKKTCRNDKDGYNGNLTIVTGYNTDGCSSYLKSDFENYLNDNAAKSIRNRSIVYITPEYLFDVNPTETIGAIEYIEPGIKEIDDEIERVLSGANDCNEPGTRIFRKLQSLIKQGVLRKDTVLIWDGVENFLHPQWQVIMSGLLVKFAKNGIHIKAKTFSPYIVQGIRFFSNKHKISPVYLLIQRGRSGSKSVDIVTHDLNRVFIMFALPLDSIVNLVD